MAKSKRKRVPKTVLKLPDLETIEICGLEQSHVFEFKALARPCHS